MLKLYTNYMVTPAINETPYFTWIADNETGFQKSYKIVLNDECGNEVFNSGVIEDGNTVSIKYTGPELKEGHKYSFSVTITTSEGKELTQSSYFRTHYKEWTAKLIGFESEKPVYLRKEFKLNKAVKSAVLYSTAHGIYEVYINGEKVGDEVLAPGWTDYLKRLQYQTYDVTKALTESNCISAIISDGWFFGRIGMFKKNQYGKPPYKFMAELVITYEDGEKEVIKTDNTFKCSTGAYEYSGLLDGEHYDANLELEGFGEVGYDDSKLTSAEEFDADCSLLVPQVGYGLKKMLEIKPIVVNKVEDKFVFDMGQNMVGVLTLSIDCPKGKTITLSHGEMLNPDGTLYTTNLRTANQVDTYITKEGYQEYTPKFTLHGFRYVEVSGIESAELSMLKGNVIYAGLEKTGTFECSDKNINKLYSNIVWSQRGNFNTVPTDCPQRDERLGWTADAQIFANTACFNMDSAAYYNKFMQDMVDAQMPGGGYTDIAPMPPHNVNESDGMIMCEQVNPAWADAGIIIPYILYEFYNDKNVIAKHYDSMKKYLDYIINRSENYITSMEWTYCDWLNVDDKTDISELSTAFVAYSASLFSEMAYIIGKEEDSKYYREIYEKVKSAYQEKFIEEDGKIKSNSQTTYLLALKFDLVKDRKQALTHLLNKIKERDYHLTTGFVGIKFLLPVLTEEGEVDLAYRILLNETYPSWIYSIKNGATTMWERWNSYTAEEGFGDAGMNSFNHYSFGSCGEWFFKYMAGINSISDAFGKILIKPYFKMDYVKAEYNSIRGKISSVFKDNKLYVEIPFNTEAVVDIKGKQYEVTAGKHIFEV